MQKKLAVLILLLSVTFSFAYAETTAKDYFDRATLQYLVGEYDSALKNLRESLRLDPGSSATIELMKTIQREMRLPKISEQTENAKLIEDLMASGKEEFARANYSKASEYFNRVLSIDPTYRDGAQWLSRTEAILAQQRVAADNWRNQRNYLIFAGSLLIGLIGIAALVSFIAVTMRRSTTVKTAPVRVAPAAPRPVQSPSPAQAGEAEKPKPIRLRVSWTKNPFGLEVFKHDFTGEEKMGYKSMKNFLKSRIESSGGQGTEPFTESALEKIFEISRGKPRTALIVCDWSITQATNQGMDKVTAEVVRGYEAVAAKNILIVDDEEVVRNTLDGILRRGGGYETDFAVDGSEAIKKIRENSYGVILLDLALPKVDGYEVLRQARLIRPDLPIIFITGTAEAHKVMESLTKYDLTGLIEKPFTMEKVLDATARALKK